MLVVAGVVIRYRTVWMKRLGEWRRKWESSESSFFDRFVSACKTNDPNRTLRSLVQWLDAANDASPAPRLDTFLAKYGDEQSLQQLRSLETAVDRQAESWNTEALVGGIKRARERWLDARRRGQRATESPLPPLRSPNRVDAGAKTAKHR